MKRYRLEIIIFIINAIYMILELIASRLLSPYFGNSNMVWTSVIGIILLSTSVGNYVGGTIADKKDNTNNVRIILAITGILIMTIPLIQNFILLSIVNAISSIKIGAIIATLVIFFIPSMFIGMLSPIVVKLKMNDINNVGKISGRISAIATLGSITGTFLGGFFLIPIYGSNQILFVLSIIVLLLILLVKEESKKNKFDKITLAIIFCMLISGTCFGVNIRSNELNGEKVLNGKFGVTVNYDTQYGKVTIYNTNKGENSYRHLNIDRGNESASYIDESKCYELVYEYTKYYDLMFQAKIEIKDALLIGGAGYSYPKYYISHYLDKKMDVVEIDGKVTEIAKKYFYLDKLIEEFELKKNNRLNLITQDGRVYLNKNTKKYDAILNDAFSGESPAKTLTTLEAIKEIHNSLNENGLYLTNIISSIEGKDSKFIKAEINTIKQVFKNVYVVPCNDINDVERRQNNMVIATDDELKIDNTVDVNIDNQIVITDNYCPVDSLIPGV